MSDDVHTSDHAVAIIGAGFSGLCMAIKLKEAGIRDFVVLERAADVGGVWRDNTYPGCACDIPSPLYSFSFAPNPDWSRFYPTQAELRAYLGRCADDHGVRPFIRFGCSVRGADYDTANARWNVQLETGETLRARVLVNGAGVLNRPAIPDLPGIQRFAGPAFHSAQWDHSIDFAGKRVAIIGTGASAIQIVPELAPRVNKLVVMQRTPPWVLPKNNPAFGAAQRRLFRLLPLLQRMLRTLIYWVHELAALNFLGHGRAQLLGKRAARDFLAQEIPDEALRTALTPNYRVGCKRVLLSNDYLKTFNRDNVALVTQGIAEVREQSIVTRDGSEHPVDVIVYGTGFKVTEFVGGLQIRGLGGVPLHDVWQDHAPSYLGIAVHGFPNFFVLTGPNTGLGHNSMVFMIEAQVHYVVRCVKALQEKQLRSLEVKQAAQDRFGEEMARRTQGTVWVSGCHSWYLSKDGSNFTLWPGFTFQYWWRTRRPQLQDFEQTPAAPAAHAAGRLTAEA